LRTAWPDSRQPRVEPGDAVLEAIERRQHQDRGREPTSPKGGAHREAIEPGQDDIEDHQFVRVGGGPGERLVPIADHIGRMAVGRQRRLDGVGNARFVLDDQDPQGSSSVCDQGSGIPPTIVRQALVAAAEGAIGHRVAAKDPCPT
jgi:hypothetical protein